MKRVLKSTALLTILCIVAVTILIISFNGGISLGGSNHFGQLPVVRRALDPNYLPGDFTIAIRQYHHRVFTYLVASLSLATGEDRALILMHIIGMSLLTYSLWLLCRAVNLSLSGFVAVGLFLATNLVWTGKGLELNHLVGDADIMPPTFAHAFVLLTVMSLLRDRYLWAALFAGLATVFHLQIGLICAVMIAPLYLFKLKQLGVIRTLAVIFLFFIAAAPGLIDLLHMLRGGLMRSPSAEYSLPFYIDFRHPHHFELISMAAALWIVAHVAVQVFAYRFLRRLLSPETHAVGKMAVMSLTLTALAIIHFTDYYLIKDGRVATIQFIRLSSLITVFGAVSLVVLINEWTNTLAAKTGNSRIGAYCSAGLILIGSLWGVREALKPEAVFQFGIVRYREQSSHWINMCRWIRSNGPRDKVYLTPPGANGFLSVAERSNVVDFKNNPDSGLYLAQWFERLRDLAGGTLPSGRGTENRQSFNRAYAALSERELIEIGKRYGAGFAVLPGASNANFEVIHQNEGYRLVRLPIN